MIGKCGARRRYIRLHHMKDIHNNGWGVYWVSRRIYLFIVWRHPASLRLRVWSGSCWAENHTIKHCMRLHGYTAQLLLDIITWCPGSLSSNTNKHYLHDYRVIRTGIWYIEDQVHECIEIEMTRITNVLQIANTCIKLQVPVPGYLYLVLRSFNF